jgi:hypothetical protein
MIGLTQWQPVAPLHAVTPSELVHGMPLQHCASWVHDWPYSVQVKLPESVVPASLPVGGAFVPHVPWIEPSWTMHE